MKVVLLDEAQRTFEAEDAWWREHRGNKELFIEELTRTLERLSEQPGIGRRYRLTRGKLIHRLLMASTGCHLYYFYDREREVIEVHSIWGARRKGGPKL